MPIVISRISGQMSILMCHKSLGACIMVSDFIAEVNIFLQDDREEAQALLETSKEGYFTHEHLLGTKSSRHI